MADNCKKCGKPMSYGLLKTFNGIAFLIGLILLPTGIGVIFTMALCIPTMRTFGTCEKCLNGGN